MTAWYSITEWGLVIMVILGCVVGLGVFLFRISRFKHKFRVKLVTGTKTIIVDDKAKLFNDKDGVTWMKLMKRKHIIQVPPADCMDVTERGNFSVEAYYSDEGWYQFEKSASQDPKLADKMQKCGEEWKQDQKRVLLKIFKWTVWKRIVTSPARYVFIKDQPPDVEGTDVLTTKQKIIMVNQIEKAKARKGFNWRDHVPMMIGVGAIILLITVIMVFWGEFAAPMNDAIKEFAGIQKSQQETAKMQKEHTALMGDLVRDLTKKDPWGDTTQDKVILENISIPG